jgi:hypothetical protein
LSGLDTHPISTLMCPASAGHFSRPLGLWLIATESLRQGSASSLSIISVGPVATSAAISAACGHAKSGPFAILRRVTIVRHHAPMCAPCVRPSEIFEALPDPRSHSSLNRSLGRRHRHIGVKIERTANAKLHMGFADKPDHIGEKKRKPRASRGFQEAKSSI